jgi:hypothetical protein
MEYTYFPNVAGIFSPHLRVQTGSGAHTASYPMGKRGSFPGGKAAEAKSAWRYTSTPLISLRGVVPS